MSLSFGVASRLSAEMLLNVVHFPPDYSVQSHSYADKECSRLRAAGIHEAHHMEEVSSWTFRQKVGRTASRYPLSRILFVVVSTLPERRRSNLILSLICVR